MPVAQRWRVGAGTRLSWRVWGDETVVFHHGSADTHKLSAVGAEALRYLERGPLTVSELAERVAGAMGVGVDEGLLAALEELVRRLDELGLIEPVS